MKAVLSVDRSYLSLPQRALRAEWTSLKSAGLLLVGVLREWRGRRRDRAQLARLDDRLLRDIGVSRGDVLAEINKPFWRR